MNFNFSEDQLLMKEEVKKLLDDFEVYRTTEIIGSFFIGTVILQNKPVIPMRGPRTPAIWVRPQDIIEAESKPTERAKKAALNQLVRSIKGKNQPIVKPQKNTF